MKNASDRNIMITVSQDIYERLVTESGRRKIVRESNCTISGIAREAVAAYLVRGPVTRLEVQTTVLPAENA